MNNKYEELCKLFFTAHRFDGSTITIRNLDDDDDPGPICDDPSCFAQEFADGEILHLLDCPATPGDINMAHKEFKTGKYPDE